MRYIARAVCFLVALAPPLLAQTVSESRPIGFSIAAGPTHSFRGVDAAGAGVNGGISYRLGHDFGLKLEATGHWYQQQPLYPCMVQDADRCYQTMRRSVSAGVLSATYHLSRFARDKGRATPYLMTGVGIYESRRIATHYPDCQPPDLCADRFVYKWEMRDTQFGWSGGLGLDFMLGPVATFTEMRLHYIYRDTPGGQPSNDYFLWPVSVGLRF